MEYTVKKLAQIAGVSSRTLRYYDEIGILKPSRINSSGYRIYGQKEVDELQHILFYRELNLDLESIKDILTASDFSSIKALKEHKDKLLNKKMQLEILIKNVDKTIESKERGIKMNDKEKFEGFKRNLIEENEKKYGDEIREKYGQDSVNRANNKIKNMSEEEYDKITKLSEEVIETLHKAFLTGNPEGELAQKTADLHRQWVSFYWEGYTKEAHANLAQMYVDDERFKAYYDKEQSGVAEFLRDAIFIYTGHTKSVY